MTLSRPSADARISPRLSILRLAALVIGLAASAIALSPKPAAAQDSQPGRLSLIEENDSIVPTGQDRHYTQGLRIAYLSSTLPRAGFWDRRFDDLGFLLPMFRAAPDAQRRFEWQVLGQSEFTPTDLKLTVPDPKDRPYAGWLYTGFDWLQENGGHSLNNLEIQAGIVGPAALAKQVQNGFHSLAGFGSANGYDHQLKNRGAFQLSYEYKRRIEFDVGRGYGFDLIPEAGLSLGSVTRYVEVSGLLRFGNGLRADYGPERIRPALSGTAFFDQNALDASRLHFYLFTGVQGRRVFYNRFIDGSAEIQPEGIGRQQEVADFVGGVTLLYRHSLRADFSTTLRTHEYSGQPDNDIFGAATISVGF